MLPPFLVGPAIGAGLVLAGAVAGLGWLHLVHDPAIRAAYAAELDAQVAAARAEDQKRAIAAMADLEERHRAQLAQASTIRERVIRVPVTTACAAAPAVAAALDGLRAGAGPAGATGGAPGAAGMPGRPAAPAGTIR